MMDEWLTKWLTRLFFPGQQPVFCKPAIPAVACTAGLMLITVFAMFGVLNHCRSGPNVHPGTTPGTVIETDSRAANSGGAKLPVSLPQTGDNMLSPGPAGETLPIEPAENASNTSSQGFGKRTYEAQFFTNNLTGNLDYQALKEAGIETIIFRVFQDEIQDGGLYFDNPLFRTLSPRLEEIATDLALNQMEEGEEYASTTPQLKLCAWMITRRFCWVKEQNFFDYQYVDGKRERIRKFDIFNPLAIEQIVQIFQELARKPIASILIQDDFFLRYNEGFSDWGKDAFAQAAGSPAIEKLMMEKDTPYYRKWNAVKKQQINKVLKAIVRGVKQVAPGIKIGMNIYYETPVYVEHAEAWYAHNMEEILTAGLDNIYLMSYQRQIKEEMELDEDANRELFREIVEKAYALCGNKLVVKIQLRDWRTGKRISLEEARAYMALIPSEVQRVCFTPVTPRDIPFIAEMIGQQ